MVTPGIQVLLPAIALGRYARTLSRPEQSDQFRNAIHPRSSEGLLLHNPHRGPGESHAETHERRGRNQAPLRVLDGFRATAKYAGARFPGFTEGFPILECSRSGCIC
jgi:hypothetical protein